jgi:AsmA protein
VQAPIAGEKGWPGKTTVAEVVESIYFVISYRVVREKGRYGVPRISLWGLCMKVLFKYGLIPLVVFCLLVSLMLILAPVLLNVQQFVPRLEKEISRITGRSFTLGHDLSLSFFPWLSLSCSEMKLGNPPGFSNEHLLQVSSFEARIKVLPLLMRRVEVSRFVVGGLSLNLEKGADGRGNWEGILAADNGSPLSPNIGVLAAFLENFSCAVLAVTDGQVRWRDAAANSELLVDDIMLLFNNFTATTAVAVDAKASVAGKSLALEGKIGPLLGGAEGKIAFDLGIDVIRTIKARLAGFLVEGDGGLRLLGSYEVPTFSPLDVLSALSLPLEVPMETGQILSKATFKGGVRLEQGRLFFENGSGLLDETTFKYSLAMDGGVVPKADFTIDFERLDLSRYMLLPWGKSAPSSPKALPGVTAALLSMLRSGTVGVATYTHGALTVGEVKMPITITKDRLLVSNATGNIAHGLATADITYPLHADNPKAEAKLTLRQVDSTVLVRDWIGKEVVRGPLSAEVDLTWEPRAVAPIIERMSGEGTLSLGEGVLLGVDLTDPAAGGSSPPIVSGDSAVPSTVFTSGQTSLVISRGMVELGDAAFALPAGKMDIVGVLDMMKQLVELETTASTVATVVNKKGREEQQQRTVSHTITGPIATPEISNRQGLLTTQANSRLSAKKIFAEKMPPPSEEGLGPLVGKDLVDPAVVAERFRLQREVLQTAPMKKKLILGSGRIRLGDLRQEETLR